MTVALCTGAAAGPEVSAAERLLALTALGVLAWGSHARGVWLVAAVGLGLTGAVRQHAIVWRAVPWEDGARTARVEVLRLLEDGRAEVRLGAPGRPCERAVVRGVPGEASPGSRAVALVEVQRPPRARNPDDRNRRREALRQGHLLQGRVLEWAPATASGARPSWREHARMGAQRWLREHLVGSAPLWRALLMGDRADLADVVQERFRRLGLSHLLALSGLHVGLVAAVVLALQRRRRPTRTALLVVATWTTLAGWSPSLARAVVMLGWWWGARALRRGGSAADALAVAALAEWCLSPWRTVGLGWWLSYVATGAIVAIAPVLVGRSKLAAAMGVSMAAQLATLPWVAGAFGQVPWFSPVAMLVVGPAFAVLMSGGLVLVLIAAAVPPLASAAGNAVALLSHGFGALLAIVDRLSPGPWGHPGIGGWTWALGLASSFCCVAPLGWRWRRRVVAGLLLIAIAHLPLLVDDRMRWVSLDVGQGDAGVLRVGRNDWLVVDTGPAFSGWSAARQVVLPYLERRNARNVTLVLTHGHLDHIGDADVLLESGRVSQLVLAAADSSSGWTAPLVAAARAQSTNVTWLRRGDELAIGPKRLRCLWPPGVAVSVHANERSLVLSTTPGAELMLTGDLEWGGEGQLADLHPVTVLKVAHHGGNTGTGEQLLEALQPRWGLISCGAGNRYGHPAGPTLARLQAAGVDVLRTDQRGALMVHWRGMRCWVTSVRPSP